MTTHGVVFNQNENILIQLTIPTENNVKGSFIEEIVEFILFSPETSSLFNRNDVLALRLVNKRWKRLAEDDLRWVYYIKNKAYLKDVWESTFGDVGDVPELHSFDVFKLLRMHLPYRPRGGQQLRVENVYIPVLLPKTVNNEEYTVNGLIKLAKNSKKNCSILFDQSPEITKELGKLKVEYSCIKLMTKNFIYNTAGTQSPELEKIVQEHDENQVLGLLDMLTLRVMAYSSGIPVYSCGGGDPGSCTRVREIVNGNWRVYVENDKSGVIRVLHHTTKCRGAGGSMDLLKKS
jgi:hypothetical protein